MIVAIFAFFAGYYFDLPFGYFICGFLCLMLDSVPARPTVKTPDLRAEPPENNPPAPNPICRSKVH